MPLFVLGSLQYLEESIFRLYFVKIASIIGMTKMKGYEVIMYTLKKFIRYYGPYKTVFFLDLLCAAIISLVDLAFPQILRTLTATVFTEEPSTILKALLPIGLCLLIMYVIQSFCVYYVGYQGHMMGAKMERDMRQQLFDHYEKLSFSYYDQNNSGQMMSKTNMTK